MKLISKAPSTARVKRITRFYLPTTNEMSHSAFAASRRAGRARQRPS